MVKQKSEEHLYRLALRAQQRADKDLSAFKRTGNKIDKTYYHRHRMKSLYYRKKLDKRIAEKVTIKTIREKALKTHPVIQAQRKQRLTERRMRKTRFVRTIKYKDEKGKTRKERVKYGFTSQGAIQEFKDLVTQGMIPVPKSEDERQLLVLSEDTEEWNIYDLVALYKGS